MGYNIFPNKSGIIGDRRNIFFDVLESFDNKYPCDLMTHSHTEQLCPQSKQKCCLCYSVVQIAREMEQAVKWFTHDATFYNIHTKNIVSLT